MCELPCIQAGPHITHNTQFMYSNPNVINARSRDRMRGVVNNVASLWARVRRSAGYMEGQ